MNATGIPTSEHVEDILSGYFGRKTLRVERFSTGLSHYVFDVVAENDFTCVIRLALPERRSELESGLYWHEKLEQIGVRLPKVYLTGEIEGFRFIVYERLPGADLEVLYPSLTVETRRQVAHAVADIQHRLGFLNDPRFENAPQWPDMLRVILNRSEREILKSDLCDKRFVDLVRTRIHHYDDHVAAVKPVAFLYDISVRNVITHNESVNGIVDVDEVWFGDPLLAIGRGKTILLCMRQDIDFISYWCDYWNLSELQMKMVDLYALLYSVRFMGTLGQKLNGNRSIQTDPENVELLEAVAQNLLHAVDS